MRKLRRAQQRRNEGPFSPMRGAENPPSFRLSYCYAILGEMIQWKRSLPIFAGILFLGLQGVSVWLAFFGSISIWLGASVLADHVKYWYFFRPVRDGVFERPGNRTVMQRSINELQSYWVSNILAIVVLWIAF